MSSMNDPEDAVAIIGMASRFPGEGRSVEGFWEMLYNARTAHSKVPSSRYNAAAWYHPDPDRKGGIVTDSGCFIDDDLSLFDATFHSMTAEEANTMDPMHRLMLELAYESMENAGMRIPSVAGENIGCYMGTFTKDYDYIQTADLYEVGPYTVTGNGLTMLSNRVSWFYDLRGPSMTLDTACSSGLYALHLACQSIALKEINTAIVGGVNLMMQPNTSHTLSKMRMIGPDGIGHVFDHRANGYGRGEGIATLVVKRLRDALRDGDTIRAVIRATGVNQDGHTPGITQPNPSAQADLLRQTFAKAGLNMNDTTFFEAHGTGTPIGDPYELSALGASFGAVRDATVRPLYVSSVKSNIGHTEGCSAHAGIIKSVLMLERGVILPNAGVEKLNPKLMLADWKLQVPTEAQPWPETKLRRIAMNSFAYGGANGTVILDDARSYLEAHGLKGNHNTVDTIMASDSASDSGFSSSSEDDSVKPKKLFAFSTSDQAGLARLTNSLSSYLAHRKEERIERSLAHTLASRRTAFDFRSFLVADSIASLHQKLQTDGLPKASRISTYQALAFVFTGQGAQWAGMGKELLHNKTFRSSIDLANVTLKRCGGSWDLVSFLESVDDRIDRPDFSQPVCTAVQIALVDLLASCGIQAQSVVGHSSGEIGAAYAAKILTAEDAMIIAWHRGVLSADVPRRLNGKVGSMMAAGLSETQAQTYIQRLSHGKVAVIACINSPSSVTISGDSDAIDELETMIKADDKFARKLKVHTAYHSPHMQAVAGDYLELLKSITPQKAGSGPRMFSSVLGKVIDKEDLDGAYWVSNMVSPVRFSNAVSSLLEHTVRVKGRRRPINFAAVIEIGPHQALKGPFQQTIKELNSRAYADMVYTSPLVRSKGAETTFLECVGTIWSRGVAIDLNKVNGLSDIEQTLSDLPPYPWNHSKGFWHESRLSKGVRHKKYPRTDLLGAPILNQNSFHPRWRNFLNIRENPWLEQHRIQGTTLFPGAGMLIMALEAAAQWSAEQFPERELHGFDFRNTFFGKGLVIPGPKESVETAMHFVPVSTSDSAVVVDWSLFSMTEDWTKHSWGQLRIIFSSDSIKKSSRDAWKLMVQDVEAARSRATQEVDVDLLYKGSDEAGMGYGELFRNLVEAKCSGSEAIGKIKIPDTKSAMPHQYEYPHFIHPATLDALFHLMFVAVWGGKPMDVAAVPISMESMFIAADLLQGAGSSYAGYATYDSQKAVEKGASLIVSDERWSEAKIVINCMALRALSTGNSSSLDSDDGSIITSAQYIADVDQPLLSAHWDLTRRAQYFVRRLCQKNFNVQALFSTSDNQLIEMFAPKHSERSRLGRCVLAFAGAKELSDRYKASGLVVEPQEVQQALDDRYDLVVLGDVFMEDIFDAVKPGGHIISRRGCLPQNFTVISNERSDLIIARKNVLKQPALIDERVAILTATSSNDSINALAASLSDWFESTGTTATLLTLSNLETEVPLTAVVSLIDLEAPVFSDLSSKNMEIFKRVCGSASYLFWITRHSADCMASVGALRTIRTEMASLRLPVLELSPSTNLRSQDTLQIVKDLISRTAIVDDADIDLEYREIDGLVLLSRSMAVTSMDKEVEASRSNAKPQPQKLRQAGRHVKLAVITPGNLTSTYWQDFDLSSHLEDDEVEISVEAVGITADDAAVANGLSVNRYFGREATGTIVATGKNVTTFQVGDHVVAVKQGTLQTTIRQRQGLVQKIAGAPEEFLSALDYAAAYHALHNISSLCESQKVLITSCGQGLTDVVIQVARTYKAEVFVAAVSPEESAQLERLYSIPRDHLSLAGDLNFERLIHSLTAGQGVSVVVNLADSETAKQAMCCLEEFGHFVNINDDKMTVQVNPSKEVTFTSFSRLGLLEKRPALLESIMSTSYELIRSGQLAGVPAERRNIKEASKCSDALAEVASGVQGIVLRLSADEKVPMMPLKPQVVRLDAKASYVIVGGLGGLGPTLITRMIEQGARHIITLSRRGPDLDERQRGHVSIWEAAGCRISTVKCDCSDRDSVKAFVARANTNGWKIRGAIQAAMVLKDAPFAAMTHEQWTTGIKPKIDSSRNLHLELPTDMDFFIMLSSVCKVIGNVGQAQYVAGNAYEEGLAELRIASGMTATCVDVGIMTGSRESSEDVEAWNEMLLSFPQLVPLQVGLSELQTVTSACMRGSLSDGSKLPTTITTGIRDNLGRNQQDLEKARWQRDPRFQLRRVPQWEVDLSSGGSNVSRSVTDQLKAVESLEDATKVIELAIRSNLALAMTAEIEDIDPAKPLHASGVDSLKAVEFRNWVLREVKSDVSVFDILSALPLSSLAQRIAAGSKAVPHAILAASAPKDE